MKKKQKHDFDSPWKDVLHRYFEEFIAFFLPEAHADIDWERGYEFLDKEFQKIVRDAELGRRLLDKLVKVQRKDGREAWVLVHIEIQGQEDEDLAKRIYTYNYRILDRHDRPVASLVVLADDRIDWPASRFRLQPLGNRGQAQISGSEAQRPGSRLEGSRAKPHSSCSAS